MDFIKKNTGFEEMSQTPIEEISVGSGFSGFFVLLKGNLMKRDITHTIVSDRN